VTGDVSGDLTGRRLGNYRIEGVLGRGGMSVMYKATDVRLGRKVALKVIGDHLGADAEFRERFVDEARNTSAIDHANIVPLYDFGELDGMLYIAMRLVDGSDLASLIGGSAMEPKRALGLLDQVADALDTLHGRGLVHLDVKPANVLVTSRESAREHVYVADFGLTRRGATGHRTRGGDFLGSPTYAAPEHLRGEPLDGRTDQYALACVLYACLTGAPPYQGDVPSVIKGHLGGEPPSVSRVVPALPTTLDDVIRRGMAKNPAERYTGCVELIAAAQQALESRDRATARQPIVAAAGSAQPDRQPARHEGGAVQSYAQQPSQPQSGQPPQPGPQRPPAQQQPGQFGRHGRQGPPSGYGYGPQQGQGPAAHYGPPQQGPPPGYCSPQGAPPGYGPQQGDPMRLRPPAPANGSAFGEARSGGRRWLVPVIAAVVLIGAAVTAILVLTGGDDSEKGSRTPATQDNGPAPEIPVGPPQGSQEGDSGSSGELGPPPTSIPVVPAPGG
jgi:serine/threonine protein kinase